MHPGGRRFEPGRVHQHRFRSVDPSAGWERGFSRASSGGLGGRGERSEQAVPPESIRAYSSVWLERTPDKREVGGSNPPRPTKSRFDPGVPAGNRGWRLGVELS